MKVKTCFLWLVTALVLAASAGSGVASAGAPEAMPAKSALPPEVPAALDISADGELLLLALPSGGGLEVVNTRTGQREVVSRTPNTGYFATLSPDRRYVCFKDFWESPEGRFQVPALYDLARKQEVWLCEPAPGAGNPVASSRGQIAFTIGTKLVLLNPDLSRAAVRDLGTVINVLSFSPDGWQVAFGDADETVSWIDLREGGLAPKRVDGLHGYAPRFSPDGRRLLARSSSGEVWAGELATGAAQSLGRGAAAAWIDRETVALVEKAVSDQTVAETRVLSCHAAGGATSVLLTQTGDAEFVISPSVMAAVSPEEIALGQTHTGVLQSTAIAPAAAANEGAVTLAANPLYVVTNATTVQLQGVPYIHQLYDTADDFPGDACCNATASLMAIQYYGKLAAHPITCHSGGTHTSQYGFYVSNIYTYNGHTYNVPSTAIWGSVYAGFYGGFGYFLQDTTDDSLLHSTRLSQWISYHGLTSGTDDSVSGETGISKARAEIDANHPVVILNSLTSAGHYITCIGYFKNQHTLIFNDPYGNKNIAYPGWQGTNACYDWPGWNNGYQNLNTVWRYVYARAIPTRILGLSGDLAFGNVIAGTSAQRTLTLTNSGTATLTVTGLSYPAGFSGAWSGTIPANGSHTVAVTFSPTAVAGYGGNLSVSSDATAGASTMAVSGTGMALPVLGFSTSAGRIVLSWPTNAAGFSLRCASNCPAAGWSVVSPSPVIVGDRYVVTNTSSTGLQFYRLCYP